jgi:hypothetical protein
MLTQQEKQLGGKDGNENAHDAGSNAYRADAFKHPSLTAPGAHGSVRSMPFLDARYI